MFDRMDALSVCNMYMCMYMLELTFTCHRADGRRGVGDAPWCGVHLVSIGEKREAMNAFLSKAQALARDAATKALDAASIDTLEIDAEGKPALSQGRSAPASPLATSLLPATPGSADDVESRIAVMYEERELLQQQMEAQLQQLQQRMAERLELAEERARVAEQRMMSAETAAAQEHAQLRAELDAARSAAVRHQEPTASTESEVAARTDDGEDDESGRRQQQQEEKKEKEEEDEKNEEDPYYGPFG